jgi:hypothetical protein
MGSYPGFTTTRRDVLIAGLVGGLISARPTMATGLFGAADVATQSHAEGCVICRMSRATQLSDAPTGKPSHMPKRLLLAQAGGASIPAATNSDRANRLVVIQPGWVLVPRGDGLDVVTDHDVIVKGDRIETVRPRQPTTDPRIDAAGQILTPGFISGHSHAAAGTLTRGWIEENGVVDRSGPSRSFFRAMDLIDSLSDDDLDDLTALNVAEMVRGGCTTQVEMSLSLKQVQSYVRVATKYGVRGFGGGMVPGMTRLGPIWNRPPGRTDILESADADTLAEIAANLKYARSVHGSADGRIN